uniref:Uncharacterized protein n=1 Tax=Avena sativa TaxID=4498 RepID=A0ACD5YJR1_AVESA
MPESRRQILLQVLTVSFLITTAPCSNSVESPPGPGSNSYLGTTEGTRRRGAMVLIPLVRDYIDRMLHDVSGMKVLVLDPQTVRRMILLYECCFVLQEFYADFCAIDPFHFTLNIRNNHIYMLPMVVDPPGMQSFCDRAVDGIASLFLALKRRPVIRYQRTSDVAKRIAQETAVGPV